MTRAVSRRALAGAASVLLAIPAATATPGTDAVLLARVEDFVEFLVEERALLATLSDEEQAWTHAALLRLARDGVATRRDRLATAIARLPACTPEGLRAKARAAAWNAGDDTALPRLLIADDLLGSLLADLTGLSLTMKGPRV